MKREPVPMVGLIMPREFPSEDYQATNDVIARGRSDDPDQVHEFVGGWLAVAYRFLACSEYDAEFTASVQLPGGDTPEQPERYRQEKSLFGFFANGLSTLDALSYALHAVGAMVRPENFPFVTPDDLRRISLLSTRDGFMAALPDARLTRALADLASSSQYAEWRDLRNILVHRSAPGRLIRRTLGSKVEPEPALWIREIPLDRQTTASRREWLSRQLSDLVSAAREFVVASL